jgi:hypothetical protein
VRTANLPDSSPGPFALPVTTQLVNGDNAICYEGVFDGADVIENEAEKFKAKVQ